MSLGPHHGRPLRDLLPLRYLAGESARRWGRPLSVRHHLHPWPHVLPRHGSRRPHKVARRSRGGRPHVGLRGAVPGSSLRGDVSGVLAGRAAKVGGHRVHRSLHAAGTERVLIL